MHRKQVRAAARTAAVGGTLVLGLGSAQAAMAQPPVTVHVPCYTGALASAISDATGGETIVLAGGCVYHLDEALPDVAVDLTIVGLDTELLRDRGATSFSLLTVDCMVDLTVVNVDFKNGGGPDDDDGGAIYAPKDTDLTVHGGIFTDNYSDDYGGAIESDGTLTVTGAYFIGNFGYYEGGAIYNGDDGGATVYGSTFQKNTTYDGDDYGGAIANEGGMQLTGSTFTGNTGVYGGAVYNDDDMTMTRDSLTGNAAYEGGGIYNDWNLTVYGSLVDFNWASDEGGGIYDWECGSFALTHSAVYGNVPDNFFDQVGGCGP
jgi:predicted outer membrane repeat protein